ncbi:outer membrane receptor protein [Echinicola vietnamensis DSM 17526]|uniref:Outer membrane receptor protein n=2 Tax=Echinicola TaxID=390846 RepID=L0G2Z8_ECHVK|nr:outer membrane receptor protein [Echinicola vietnamensis DSM 17526]
MTVWGTPHLVMGQETAILRGEVVDQDSGEKLIGASVYWKTAANEGVVSDEDGAFALPLTHVPRTLVVSYLGFGKKEIRIGKEDRESKLTVGLSSSAEGLAEVVVEGKHEEVITQSVDMGRNIVPVEALKSIPSLFGEVDVLRGLQLLPGIQTAGEGTTGLFVRGGSSDQNLIQLDGAPVYNPSHFFGFFSVFNPDALDEVDLYKGNIPATYGGRLSSVVDISMKEGRTDRIHGAGGIGNISSKITVDGPLFSDKSSFVLTGRRTYADLFLKLSNNEEINSNRLYFYDLGGKMTFRPSPKDKISISSYYGRDYLQAGDMFGFGWKNWINAAQWQKTFNKKTFLDVNGYYSRYDYMIDIMDQDNGFSWSSLLSEGGLRWFFTMIPSDKAVFEAGAHTRYYHISPVEMSTAPGSQITPITTNPGNALQQDFFVSGELEVTPKLKVEGGLRWSLYAQIGKGAEYRYDEGPGRESGEIIDTVFYDKLRPMKFYQGKEPRIALRYKITDNVSFKSAYNRNYQYLQVASNSSAGLPIDRWTLANEYIHPITSDQYSAGIYKTIQGGDWEVSLEGYYKEYDRIIDVKQGADVLFTDHLETEVLDGRGWSYGGEFLLKKNVGPTTGWFGYTYSRTFREIAGISEGKPYNPRYDRPHDISLVLQHEFSERLTANMTFVYSTGQAVSLPVGTYSVDNQEMPLYGTLRNEDRFPDYHRMDLAVTWKNKDKGKKWRGSWNVSIYNVYGRKNPYSYQFKDIVNNDIHYDSDSDGMVYSRRPGVVMTYLFTFLPSISYNFEF